MFTARGMDFTFASREHRIKRREKLIWELISKKLRSKPRSDVFPPHKTAKLYPLYSRTLLRTRMYCACVCVLCRLYLLYAALRTKAERLIFSLNASHRVKCVKLIARRVIIARLSRMALIEKLVYIIHLSRSITSSLRGEVKKREFIFGMCICASRCIVR